MATSARGLLERGGDVALAASSPASKLIDRFRDGDGFLNVDRIRRLYGLTRAQLAGLIGVAAIAQDAARLPDMLRQDQRLTELLDVLDHAGALGAASAQATLAWYRRREIPALGYRTAEAMVKAGQAGLVHAYIEVVASGALLP